MKPETFWVVFMVLMAVVPGILMLVLQYIFDYHGWVLDLIMIIYAVIAVTIGAILPMKKN